MDNQKKRYETEWSFSFGDVTESVGQFFKSMNIGTEIELKTSEFTEPVGNAESGRVSLGLSLGDTVVKDGSGIDNLIDAEIIHVGDVDFETSGTSERVVRLAQKRGEALGDVAAQFGSWFSGKRHDLRWNIGLTTLIPLHLDITAGVGPVDLQLSELKLASLNIQGGVGEVHATLPAGDAAYDVSISGGVGKFSVEIPEGAALTMTLQGGVGNFDLDVPERAAVRLEVEGGLGGVQLPPELIPVSEGDSFMGRESAWQTEGFDLASRQIIIHYKGGVGSLKVR